MTPRVLLVEDEPSLARTLSDRLVGEGYEVELALDGERGLARAMTQDGFDLIVLDRLLPRRDGLEVCRSLREAGIETPILMLTALSEAHDTVDGLRAGADDYMGKPFDAGELCARLEALLRRAGCGHDATSDAPFRFGDVHVDPQRARVTRAGHPVQLSARELALLVFLAQRPGCPVGRPELLREVWGHRHAPRTRTVDVHVTWLRKKLEPDRTRPRFLITVHGRGYKLEGVERA